MSSSRSSTPATPTTTAHGRARALLLGAVDEAPAAGPVTLAEVLVGPARVGCLHEATAALHQLDVRAVALDGRAPARLAVLRADTGLKLPDRCVLLAAEQARGGGAAFGDRLAAAAQRRGLVRHG